MLSDNSVATKTQHPIGNIEGNVILLLMLKRNKKPNLKNLFSKSLTWFRGLSLVKRRVLIIVLVALGAVPYNQTANYIEQRKFDRIEATVVELTDRINNEFGTKTVEMQNYCRHNREVYSKGPLACSVNSIIAVEDNLGPSLFNFLRQQKDMVHDAQPYLEDLNSGVVEISPYSIGCPVGNELLGKIYPPAHNSKYPMDQMTVTIGCGDLVRTAHYPVLD